MHGGIWGTRGSVSMEGFGGPGALCPQRDPAGAEKPQLSRERSSQGLLLAQPLEPRQEFAMGTGLSRSCRDLPCLRGFGHTQKFRASEKKPSAPGQGRGRERRNHFSAEESQGDSGSDAGSKEGREWWGEGGQPWRGSRGPGRPSAPCAQGDSDRRSSWSVLSCSKAAPGTSQHPPSPASEPAPRVPKSPLSQRFSGW